MSCLGRHFRVTIACMAVVLLAVADRAIAQVDVAPEKPTGSATVEQTILIELQVTPASLSKVDDLKKMLRAESRSVHLVVDSRSTEQNVALITVRPIHRYDRILRVKRALRQWGVSRVFIRAVATPAVAWAGVVVVPPDDVYVTLRIRNDADRKVYQDLVNRITAVLGTDVKAVSLTMAQGNSLTTGPIISAEVMAGHNVKYDRIERVRKTLRSFGVGSLQFKGRHNRQVGGPSSPPAADSRRDLASVRKASLRKSVEQEFELRQAQQRQELARLKARLVRIERLIEAREKNKDRIIDRRVEELRNPALRWDATDPGPPTSAGVPSVGSPGGAMPGMGVPGAGMSPPPRSSASKPAATISGMARRLSAAWRSATGTEDELCRSNLKRLGVALHNYHHDYKRFPPAVFRQKEGKKLEHPYSWRVALLPYLDEPELYRQYRFDEPWDSESNRKVLKQMPSVYRHPGADKESVYTAYFALVGPGTAFEGSDGVPIRRFFDGTSNTILLVEAKRATEWTKPEDIPYVPDGPLPAFGGFHGKPVAGFYALMADAAPCFFPATFDPNMLRRAITRADRQIVRLPGR